MQRRRYSNRAAAVRKCRKERHSAAFLSLWESPRECGGCGKARRWERQGLEIKKVQVCKSVYGNNKFDGSLLRNF